jgi:hypothetical protein
MSESAAAATAAQPQTERRPQNPLEKPRQCRDIRKNPTQISPTRSKGSRLKPLPILSFDQAQTRYFASSVCGERNAP